MCTSSRKVSSCVFSSIQLHTWMYLLGYLMAFGTTLAKMWRVYRIFHNSTPNKMVGNIITWSCMLLQSLVMLCCNPCTIVHAWVDTLGLLSSPTHCIAGAKGLASCCHCPPAHQYFHSISGGGKCLAGLCTSTRWWEQGREKCKVL